MNACGGGRVDGLRPGPPAAGDVEVGAGFAAGDVGRLRRGRGPPAAGGRLRRGAGCAGGREPAAPGDVSRLRRDRAGGACTDSAEARSSPKGSRIQAEGLCTFSRRRRVHVHLHVPRRRRSTVTASLYQMSATSLGFENAFERCRGQHAVGPVCEFFVGRARNATCNVSWHGAKLECQLAL